MSPLDLDTWQELGDALRASPVRTALTMAAVCWGTFVLVLMLGFSVGLEEAAYRTLRGSVTNAVFVWGGRTRLPYRGRQPGRWVHYRNSDIAALQQLEGMRYLAPRNQLGGYRDGTPVVHGSETGAFEIMGDTPAFAHIQTVVWDAGRFINPLDLELKRKVAVIGGQVHEALWPDNSDPIGDWIRVRGVYFQVVGLFHSRSGDDRGDREEQTIHIPFTTFQQSFNMGDRVRWFAMIAAPGFDGTELEAKVKAILAERHDVHPEDSQALGSYNAEREYRRIQGLFAGIRGLTWLVGAATLLSGAVGVSNVLLIVVRERTSEIGVRRALGATPGSIISMILFEALTMTGLAGLAGLIGGVVVLELAALAIGPDNPSFGLPRIEPGAALAALGLLGIAGGIAGVMPARRAVAIQPVEALRTE